MSALDDLLASKAAQPQGEQQTKQQVEQQLAQMLGESTGEQPQQTALDKLIDSKNNGQQTVVSAPSPTPDTTVDTGSYEGDGFVQSYAKNTPSTAAFPAVTGQQEADSMINSFQNQPKPEGLKNNALVAGFGNLQANTGSAMQYAANALTPATTGFEDDAMGFVMGDKIRQDMSGDSGVQPVQKPTGLLASFEEKGKEWQTSGEAFSKAKMPEITKDDEKRLGPVLTYLAETWNNAMSSAPFSVVALGMNAIPYAGRPLSVAFEAATEAGNRFDEDYKYFYNEGITQGMNAKDADEYARGYAVSNANKVGVTNTALLTASNKIGFDLITKGAGPLAKSFGSKVSGAWDKLTPGQKVTASIVGSVLNEMGEELTQNNIQRYNQAVPQSLDFNPLSNENRGEMAATALSTALMAGLGGGARHLQRQGQARDIQPIIEQVTGKTAAMPNIDQIDKAENGLAAQVELAMKSAKERGDNTDVVELDKKYGIIDQKGNISISLNSLARYGIDNGIFGTTDKTTVNKEQETPAGVLPVVEPLNQETISQIRTAAMTAAQQAAPEERMAIMQKLQTEDGLREIGTQLGIIQPQEQQQQPQADLTGVQQWAQERMDTSQDENEINFLAAALAKGKPGLTEIALRYNLPGTQQTEAADFEKMARIIGNKEAGAMNPAAFDNKLPEWSSIPRPGETMQERHNANQSLLNTVNAIAGQKFDQAGYQGQALAEQRAEAEQAQQPRKASKKQNTISIPDPKTADTFAKNNPGWTRYNVGGVNYFTNNETTAPTMPEQSTSNIVLPENYKGKSLSQLRSEVPKNALPTVAQQAKAEKMMDEAAANGDYVRAAFAARTMKQEELAKKYEEVNAEVKIGKALERRDYPTAISLARQTGDEKRAQRYEQAAQLFPVQPAPTKQPTAEIKTNAMRQAEEKRFSYAYQNLSEEQQYFVDVLRHYGVTLDSVANELRGERDQRVNEYATYLRNLLNKADGAKQPVETKSGDTVTRTYSTRPKWALDMAKQLFGKRSWDSLKKADKEYIINEATLDHLRNGFTDPYYGEVITQDASAEFNVLEATLNEVEGTRGTINKYLPEWVQQSKSSSASGNQNIRQAAEQFKAVNRETGSAESPVNAESEGLGRNIQTTPVAPPNFGAQELEPVKTELQKPDEQTVSQEKQTKKPALDSVRSAYTEIAKENFNGQTANRAVSLKEIQKRLGISDAGMAAFLSDLQKQNLPGIELGYARDQDKAIRVPTATGEQRYSSITFYDEQTAKPKEQSKISAEIERVRKQAIENALKSNDLRERMKTPQGRAQIAKLPEHIRKALDERAAKEAAATKQEEAPMAVEQKQDKSPSKSSTSPFDTSDSNKQSLLEKLKKKKEGEGSGKHSGDRVEQTSSGRTDNDRMGTPVLPDGSKIDSGSNGQKGEQTGGTGVRPDSGTGLSIGGAVAGRKRSDTGVRGGTSVDSQQPTRNPEPQRSTADSDTRVPLNQGTTERPTADAKNRRNDEDGGISNYTGIIKGDLQAKKKALQAALSKKLNQMSINPVFDPETMGLVFQLGAVNIQIGMNKFSAWSKQMIDDMGERIKPYLESAWASLNAWPSNVEFDEESANLMFEYVGVKYEEGMTDLKEIEKHIRGELGDGYVPLVKPAYEGVSRWPREEENLEEVEKSAYDDETTAKKRDEQRKAEKVSTKVADLDNIRETLPFLMPEQQEDVLFAEQRLTLPDGRGVLFTNGTGTGKTYSGIGIVKRYARQGKNNIIIVAPSDKILQGWINAGENMGLTITQLEDTKNNGEGIVATTYANFGKNDALARRNWDLVLCDESHTLTSSESGSMTNSVSALRASTMNERGFYSRFEMLERELLDEIKKTNAELKAAQTNTDGSNKYRGEIADAEKRVRDLYREADRRREQYFAEWNKIKNADKPRTVFLSATPFAYLKSIDYADGYLFDYGKKEPNGYNSTDGQQQFMVNHFGYRMRYNKLTEPDANVNREVMEQQFHQWLRDQGSLSGRSLKVDYDYDRKFVLVDDAIGTKIDEGLKWLSEAEDRRFYPIYELINDQFDYLKRMFLLESIKARHAVPVIKKHIAQGKKVVLFHGYKKGGGFHPFKLNFVPEEAKSLYQEFANKRKDLFNLSLDNLPSPIETMKQEFGEDVLLFNGDVKSSIRSSNVDQFNDDNSGKNLIVVQADAGREGISLHDQTGKHQRVLINLGMPTRPTAAIQIEGRIYRVGQKSNAIFRYFNTGTSFERYTFATTIASRASTAENLALGTEARRLKAAFIDAFVTSDEYVPDMEGEGLGGKESDRAGLKPLSDFERSKTYYFAQGKKTSRNKSTEGTDYYATPEPIGYKMVEWANLQGGERALEPSAGHGAIARFFPPHGEHVMIEPSLELGPRATMVSSAKLVSSRFEDFNIINKFDAIVMNPPFGHGGKTAIEHLAKAANHLNNGGRIIALIPDGGMTGKRFYDWHESDAAKGMYLVGEVKLPPVAFERAGTSVATRIVILEKHNAAKGQDAPNLQHKNIDLSNVQTINELFDRIEDLSMPDRTPIVLQKAQQAESSTGGSSAFTAAQFNHTKTKKPIFIAKPKYNMGDNYDKFAAIAKSNNGWWNRYGSDGAIKGFAFNTEKDRDAFLEKVNGETNESPVAKEEVTPYNVREELIKNHPAYETDKEALALAEKGIQLTLDFEQNGTVESTSGILDTTGNGKTDQKSEIGRRSGVQSRETIGLGITRKLIKDGVVSLIGKRVRTARELAVAAQVLRHPGYETFHTFYVQGGKIVHQESVSSKLPSVATIAEAGVSTADLMQRIHDNVDRLNADGYYFVHNHPSGKPNPSHEDISLTKMFGSVRVNRGKNNVADKFLGHVIINSGEFSFIDKSGNVKMEKINKKYVEKILMPEIDHPLLGMKISRPRDVANLAKAIQMTPNASVVFYLTAQLEVRGIETVPNSMLNNEKNVTKFLGDSAIAHYSAQVVVVTGSEETRNKLKPLLDSNDIVNIVFAPNLNNVQPMRDKDWRAPDGRWFDRQEANSGQRVFEDNEKYSTDSNTDVSNSKKADSQESRVVDLAKALGVKAEIIDHPDTSLRGYYKNGTLYLNRNGNLSMEWTLGHEFTHWLAENKNGMYMAMRHALGIVSNEQIEAYRKRLGERGKGMNRETIIEEMLGDEVGNGFGSNALWEKLQKKSPTLFQHIVKSIKEWLLSLIDKKAHRESGLTKQQILDIETLLPDILRQELKANGYVFAHEAKEFIAESLNINNAPKTLLLRQVSDKEVRSIMKVTGIDVSGYSHALNSSDIRHILNSHGVGKEKQKDQIPLTEDDLSLIPDILDSPEEITKGSPSYRGEPTIRYIKSDPSGSYTVVEVVKQKGKLLSVKTMWKKRIAENYADIAVSPHHTSETEGNKTSSSNSILQQNEKDVNGKGVYSSVDPQNGTTFAEQIDAWASGTIDHRSTITVCQTPEVLLNLGVKQYPVEISQKTLAKVANQEGVNGGKHGLSLELLKKLPEQLTDPVMIFESATQPNSIVVMTEMIDANNRSIIVAIALERQHHSHMVNAIASVYGRNNEFSFVLEQIDKKRLLYQNKEKSRAWLRSGRLKLPPEVAQQHDSINSILQQGTKDVNGNDIRYSKDEKDSTQIGASATQALDSLAEKLGMKTADRVEVRQQPAPERMGAFSRWYNSINVLAQKHPKLTPFFRLATTAMETQENLRNHFAHRVEKWDKVLKATGDYKKNKADLYQLLLSGDMDGKDFTSAELTEMGMHPNVVAAYRMVRTAMDHAYKLANEVRQGIETKSENMTGAKLEKLRGNKFADILKVTETGSDNYLVSWKQPKTYEMATIISGDELAELKNNENVQITKEKLYTPTEYIRPGAQGMVRGDNFYEVEYTQQAAPISKRGGYIPHFFHDWFVMSKTKDADGKEQYTVMHSAKSMREATQWANEKASADDKLELVIQPKQFQFPGANVNAAVLGDFDYARLAQKVSDDLSISLGDAKEFLEGKAKMKNRHRFVGNFLERKGAEGYEKNLDWVLKHYFNMVSRYVALDPFKSRSISLFERLFGKFDDVKHDGLADYVRDYINDVNGVPSKIEGYFNEILEMNPFFNKWLGHMLMQGGPLGARPAAQVAQSLTNAVAVAKLGLLNVSAAAMQVTQFANAYALVGNYAITAVPRAIAPKAIDKLIMYKAGVDANMDLTSGAGYSKGRQAKNLIQNTGFMFRYMDTLMRRIAVLGAYEKAKSEGKGQPEAITYAKEVNRKANFDYGVSDTPNMFRRGGPIAQLVLQFKKYPIKQLELISELGSAAVDSWSGTFAFARFLIPYMLLAGMWGLPVGLIKELIKLMPWADDWDLEKEIKNYLIKWAGDDKTKKALAYTIMYGVLSNKVIAGVDASKRVGLGDVIPTSLKDFAGPVLSTIYNTGREAWRGNANEALKALSPGVGNVAVALAGETKGARGRTRAKYDETYERIVKGIGFMPIDESTDRDKEQIIKYKEKQRRDNEQSAIDNYIEARQSKDEEKIRSAMKRLRELRVLPARIREEIKRRQKTSLQRTNETVGKQRRKDYQYLQQ